MLASKRMLMAAGLAAALSASGGSAHATAVAMDQFVVFKNGGLYFNDTFDDGIVGNNPGGGIYTNPTPYFSLGGYVESGGKALMGTVGGVEYGTPSVSPGVVTTGGTTIFNAGDPTRSTVFRLLSNRDNANTVAGLKSDDDIVVYGLFDVSSLTNRTDQYGIALSDRGGSGNANDNLRLGPAQSTVTGIDNVNAHRLDASVSPALVSESSTDPSSPNYQPGHQLQTANQQILLRLSTAANNNAVHAEYAYVNSPGFDATNQAATAALAWNSLGSRDAFNGESWTRAEFRVLQRVNEVNLAQLVTGSPVTMSQEVDTGATPFSMTFNYRFETPTGQLDVILDGTTIASILAPATVGSSFSTANILIDDPSLLNLTDVDLEFMLDGPTGSAISLDAILFPGLLNGNFATRDLTHWTVTASPGASAGVLNIQSQSVPEPLTLSLFGLGLAGLGLAARRRKAA